MTFYEVLFIIAIIGSTPLISIVISKLNKGKTKQIISILEPIVYIILLTLYNFYNFKNKWNCFSKFR